MNATLRRRGASRGLGLMLLLSGCTAALPPPRPVALVRPHPVHRVWHRHRIRHPKPRPAVVELNRPLIRALERSALPWEAPHFTDVRIAVPAGAAVEAGTDAGRDTADSVSTIVVHPAALPVRRAASIGQAEP